ncbi:MAG: primosomal protein N' (replication factor Y) [Chitinophagales bacterium]|jgi:primosomal protein N' (replication factor Y)
MSTATFVEVILPLATPKPYTYALPFDLADKVKKGHRVIVQFGKRRMYSAIVLEVHHRAPQDYKAKLIEELAEEEVIVNEHQLKLWQWISTYYLCTLGEVMSAALPSALKLSSESKFIFVENPDFDWKELTDEEYLLAEALQSNHELSMEDIQDILQKKSVYPIIEKLMVYRLCLAKEELQEKYKPKQIKFIHLSDRYTEESALQALFEKLSKSAKQTEVLLHYLRKSPKRKAIQKSELLRNDKISPSSLKTLVKNEIFVEQRQTVSRILTDKMETFELENLNPAQLTAYDEIKASYEEKAVVVLEGVTGSGKTHLYIKLIEEALEKDKQVLYLLPEIALTAQIVLRLQNYFGDKIGVYHSKFNDQERVEIYKGVLNGKTPIILSARSGVFLPYSNLGLIIVDEEHERSYKQFEPAPRYHARDTAIMLGLMQKAKVLLGSATLSFETFQNVNLGKFGHVKLSERYGNAVLPTIELIDTLALKQRKKMEGLFSEQLKDGIASALEKKEQVILFQNRRGFANYVNCNLCNWIPYCPSCDVSLTYHKFFNKLVCHYCGHQEKMVQSCKACGSNDVQIKGFGTEQIEDDIQILFPEAKVARLDLDSTRKKHGHEEIIFAFQNGEIDILIGTQMVTKGLDFDHVSLVGIINADQLFSFPDFRAAERAFQLLAQVGGRAGRKDKPGRVMIQSNQIDHPVLQHIKDYNFDGFYFEELLTRQQYHYPPYVNLIQLTIKHKKPEDVRLASTFLANELRSKLGRQVLGPSTPLVSKVRNMYLRQILIKVEKNSKTINHTKAILKEVLDETQRQFRSAYVAVEVDA